MKKDIKIAVIGAGLAGCEAAWKAAESGICVRLYEMKPHRFSPAHKYRGFAELVCSNSLKAKRLQSAAGLLKQEMRILGSLILKCAESCAVPAGGALAVDRGKFSDSVTAAINSHPNIEVITGKEICSLDRLSEEYIIVAAGPLCADALADYIKKICGESSLSFYDAVSPIVTFGSIDFENAFFAARYGRGDADYINCPLDKDEYELFIDALRNAETAVLQDFEKRKFYEGCMPVEVLAKRGRDALRFGPMRPVGLSDPRTERRPWAVVQLRKENTEGDLYNLVGFQTNLKWAEQKRVFSLIPALKNAEYVRYGVMHRNTFINSPKLLDAHLRLKDHPNIMFAGQITGVEGYTESAATGILAGINAVRLVSGLSPFVPPRESMTGALAGYLCRGNNNFQPMGANMGLLPPMDEPVRSLMRGKEKRYEAFAQRAIQKLEELILDLLGN
ncbi:MAG: methylenetetrahydrofolate--tRNA-(uracil(54)-C(5))-methyltransferase (FADH(2)-oxidizing) TrmFO [Oscillospiraceae bacterium]|nr:methylenetetrahydrofolate--tRNA-(uracil(54)-C(5))-methyltransferase (FADH(2)-oxidizing) TrmFO [Oscillospiraceae bacterium]